MGGGRRVIMVGVAVAAALLSTVGAVSVADHSTGRPADDPATRADTGYIDDKDDDATDRDPSADAPCPRAWLGQDCPPRQP